MLETQEQPPYSAELEMSCVHILSLGTENRLEMKWHLNWAKQKKALNPLLFITAEKTLHHVGKLPQAHVRYQSKSSIIVL